ncbi:MAG: hypothetical protein WBE34_08100 [Candidatus Nitrosopolaris sp.]
MVRLCLTVDLQASSQANPQVHRRRKCTVNDTKLSNLSPETNNSVICEGVGCSAKATTKVTTRLGSDGTILLFLCDNCNSKFMRSEIAE